MRSPQDHAEEPTAPIGVRADGTERLELHDRGWEKRSSPAETKTSRSRLARLGAPRRCARPKRFATSDMAQRKTRSRGCGKSLQRCGRAPTFGEGLARTLRSGTRRKRERDGKPYRPQLPTSARDGLRCLLQGCHRSPRHSRRSHRPLRAAHVGGRTEDRQRDGSRRHRSKPRRAARLGHRSCRSYASR